MKSLGDGITIGLVGILLMTTLVGGVMFGLEVGEARGEENIYLDCKLRHGFELHDTKFVCEKENKNV